MLLGYMQQPTTNPTPISVVEIVITIEYQLLYIELAISSLIG